MWKAKRTVFKRVARFGCSGRRFMYRSRIMVFVVCCCLVWGNPAEIEGLTTVGDFRLAQQSLFTKQTEKRYTLTYSNTRTALKYLLDFQGSIPFPSLRNLLTTLNLLLNTATLRIYLWRIRIVKELVASFNSHTLIYLLLCFCVLPGLRVIWIDSLVAFFVLFFCLLRSATRRTALKCLRDTGKESKSKDKDKRVSIRRRIYKAKKRTTWNEWEIYWTERYAKTICKLLSCLFCLNRWIWHNRLLFTN